MAHEVRLKVASPELLGMALLSYVSLMLGLVCLGVGGDPVDMEMISAFFPYAGALLFLVTAFSFLSEDLFSTILFGIMALVCMGMPSVLSATSSGRLGIFLLFGGLFLLNLTLMSLSRPTRLFSLSLCLLALTLISLGIWAWQGFVEWTIFGNLAGTFGFLAGLLLFYLPAAIIYNEARGHKALPIF